MLDSKPMERNQITPTDKGNGRPGAKWPGFLLRLLIIAGVTYGLFAYVVGAVFVRGDSMAPMLVNGSFVLFSRLGTDYRVGDVVVVCVDDTLSIRRIFAVGGDVILFDADDGTVSVNGRIESGYYTHGLTFAKDAGDADVSDQCAYVLADNREHAIDSRDYGEIPISSICGKLLFIARGV